METVLNGATSMRQVDAAGLGAAIEPAMSHPLATTPKKKTRRPTTAVAPVQAAAPAVLPNDPLMLVRLAIEKDLDTDKLQRLIDMQIQMRELDAKEAFAHAFAAFKREAVPTILKNHRVEYTHNGKTTAYDHATLAAVVKAITSKLAEYGISASWESGTCGPSRVRVVCVLEKGIHQRRSAPLEADFDTSGSKNNIQGQGSAITYLERYSLLASVGMATEGQDDDGRATAAANAEAIVGERTLDSLLGELKAASTDAGALAIWKVGRHALKAANNVDGANELRKAVEARRAELKKEAA